MNPAPSLYSDILKKYQNKNIFFNNYINTNRNIVLNEREGAG